MNSLRYVTYSVLDIFFPNNCELCQKHLTHTEKFICLGCKINLPFIDRHRKILESIQKIFWGRIEIEHVYSVYNYRKGTNTQKILHAIKYNSKTKLAIHMGEILGDQLPKNHTIDIIVPVPLHTKKLKKRGYNQSLLLALGVQKSKNISIVTDLLKRVKENPSQTTFSKFDRWENVNDVFDANPPLDLEHKHILLIDDVLTTGATIEACAAAIRSKIKCKISVATLAVRT